MKTLATDNTNESNYLLGGGKNNNGKRWSTIQCILFAFTIAALVGFFSNLDRIIDGLSSDDEDGQITADKITEIISDRDELSTLSSALTSANLDSTLEGEGPFTLFAPTNNAFDAITIPTNITILTDILLYHVIGDADVLSTDLSNGMVVDTINGQSVTVLINENGVFFYDSMGRLSQVTTADIIASNGVIHIIDTVLLPDGVLTDALSNIASLSTLQSAIVANGLVDVLSDTNGTFTLFAPTNDAIDAFSGSIGELDLLYHVLATEFLSDDIPADPTQITTASGEIVSVVKLNDEVFITDTVGRIAAVTAANIISANGVIHIIDIVLARAEFRSIVDLALGRDDLSTLVTALSTAGLVDTLNGEGPFTVLAPTNNAFDAILVPSNVTVLTSVLLYHVIEANVLSSDLSSGLIATTLNGESATAFISDGVFFYDSNGRSSQVLDADIVGTNGVIHIVDNVLLPGGKINDIVANIPSLSILNGALIANGLNTTLADSTGTFTLFAPTNDAINAFSGSIGELDLLYHVLATEFVSNDIPADLTPITAVSGDIVSVVRNDTGVFITDTVGRIATVTIANIVSSNGVVHIIDIVLARAEFRTIVDLASGRDDLSTLVSALSTAGLVDTLNGEGPFTVLAPTNDAFDAIVVPSNVTVLTSVLLYHVIGANVLSSDLSSGLIATTLNGETATAFIGDGVFFYDSNGRSSQVLEADIVGTNGVIHIVDAVLLPGGTVNDIVANIPSLSILNGALIANGLNTTLADPTGTFTLFAPTNDAVTAFNGEVTVDVLLYHVLATEYVSDDIPTGLTTLPTVNGATVDVNKNETGVFVQDQAGRVAAVTNTYNIKGINGVVHVIDIVLSPTA